MNSNHLAVRLTGDPIDVRIVLDLLRAALAAECGGPVSCRHRVFGTRADFHTVRLYAEITWNNTGLENRP